MQRLPALRERGGREEGREGDRDRERQKQTERERQRDRDRERQLLDFNVPSAAQGDFRTRLRERGG